MSGKQEDCAAVTMKFLPTAVELQEWHVLKDDWGPALSGSPAWKRYFDFLEAGFKKYGLIDMQKDSITYNRWYVAGDCTLALDASEIPVATYWPYSGSTGAQGITAPLVYYDMENPPTSVEGRIVVFDIPALDDPLPPEFDVYSGFEYVTDDDTHPLDGFSLRQWYNTAYPILFGGYDDILTTGGASGGLVISGMGPERAAGIYMIPYAPAAFGVPALYLDRRAGQQVREAAKMGRNATMKLAATQETAVTCFLSGFLPGKNYGTAKDEMVLLISHTDGINVTQENGGLGILSVIQYFSHIPQSERARTLLVVLDPQHYMPGRHAVDWFELHREAADKIVASLGMEHLGQLEYRERGDNFSLTGKPEVTRLFVQDNDCLIRMAVQAVKDNQLPRTFVHCPPRSGGRWEAMGSVALERNIPGFGFSADMGAHWSMNARIESFDSELALKQIAAAAQLTGNLMQADLEKIDVNRDDKQDVSFGFEKPGQTHGT